MMPAAGTLESRERASVLPDNRNEQQCGRDDPHHYEQPIQKVPED